MKYIDPDGENPWDILKGFAKGYSNAVVSANMPLSSNSPIGKIIGAAKTVIAVRSPKSSPKEQFDVDMAIITGIHEQTTLGLIEAGVKEYKAGGDGSQTGEKLGDMAANVAMETAITATTLGAGSAATATSKAASAGTKSFFEGTRYTDKVVKQMKLADYHGFPESVKAFESQGVVSTIKGGDGVARQMLKIPGEYKGKSGHFEFIKEADGNINHRYFKPNE